MKTVYLIRHAKSLKGDPRYKDHERPLDARGLRDARFMARQLAARQPAIGLIVSSPAVRALSTARYFAEALGYPEQEIHLAPEIYYEDAHWLLRFLRQTPEAYSIIALFGHNPQFSLLADHLSRHDWKHLPTCGVVSFRFEVSHWTEIDEYSSKMSYKDFPRDHFSDAQDD